MQIISYTGHVTYEDLLKIKNKETYKERERIIGDFGDI